MSRLNLRCKPQSDASASLSMTLFCHFERSREIHPCKRIGLWDFSARFCSVEMTETVICARSKWR